MIFSVYAPVEDSKDDVKNDFYDLLDMQLRTTSHYSRCILLGDFNARIGQDRQFIWKTVRGRWNIRDDLNNNGERLLDFCLRHNLIVANTLIRKSNSKVGSWKHLPTRRWYTLDHILLSASSKKSLLYSCVDHTFDCVSDHFPMTLGLKGTVLENQKQSRLAPKSCGNKKRKQHRASQKNIVVKRDFSRLKRDDELCNRVREVLQQKLNGAHFSKFSDFNDLIIHNIGVYPKEGVRRSTTDMVGE